MSLAYRQVIFADLSEASVSDDLEDRIAHLLVPNASPAIITGNKVNLTALNFEKVKNNGLAAQFGANTSYRRCENFKFMNNISLVEPSTVFPKYEITQGNGTTIGVYLQIYPTSTVCTAIKLTYYQSPSTIDTDNSTDDLLWDSPDLEDRVVKKALELATLPTRKLIINKINPK
jgi:hypothetical protein